MPTILTCVPNNLLKKLKKSMRLIGKSRIKALNLLDR